jgi:hypothetical protein
MDWTYPFLIVVALIVIGALWKSGKISKAKVKALFDRKTIGLTDEQWERMEDALKQGDFSILNKIKKEKPKKEYLPGHEQIPILSIEKNGGEFRFDMWTSEIPGVVRNNDRGRAADLGQARPKTFVIHGKTYLGFIIEGDRGVGLELDNNILKLTTTAREAWDFLQSAKLGSWLTDNLTGRQIALYLILGIIIGQMIFFFLKI